jgi:glycosyltransferase involved in cell wall biosynthesis/GT2 family glycosyltransferase
MTPKRPVVLLVSGEYPPFTNWGGNAYLLAALSRFLNRKGFEAEVIAESDNGEEFIHLDDGGNIVHRINGHRSYFRKALFAAAPWLARRLEFRDLWFAARVAEKALELSVLWNRHVLWIEATNWRAETLFLQLMPQLNARTLIRIVTPMEEVVRQNQLDRSSPDTRAALLQELFLHFLSRQRLYSNPEYKRYFEERVQTRFPFRRPAAEHTFLLPFDFGRVPVRPAVGARAPGLPRKLLMVGRIEPRKGFDAVGSALSGLSPEERRNIRILAAGRDTPFGPFDSYQRMLVEKYPGVLDECVEFLGPVSEERLRELFLTSDVGLVASTSESFGYNLVELLAANLPVITADVGAAAELERRGVRYVGKFAKPSELTTIFREMDRRIARLEAEGVDNRSTLSRVYSENDRSYLELIRTVAPETANADAKTRKPHLARPIGALDVIICSYNRFDELMLSLPSLLTEARATHQSGVACRLTVVYQNEGLPEQVYSARPDFRDDPQLAFVHSSPPSLTRARNTGLGATTGDLVLFVDDDVVLEPGFFRAHVAAADAHPEAVGVVGRIRSRIDRQRTTNLRAVGHIRASGHIDTNFDSVADRSTLVPMTPMGTNMSYRRTAMTSAFGARWFDERFEGSAFREESTLAVQIFRSGLHFVYCPDAVLYHFESVAGGCENRNARRNLRQLVRHYTLDYLFLNRLYEPSEPLRAVAPLLLLLRDVRSVAGRKEKLRRAYVNVRGLLEARRKFKQPVPAESSPASPPAEASAPGPTPLAQSR